MFIINKHLIDLNVKVEIERNESLEILKWQIHLQRTRNSWNIW